MKCFFVTLMLIFAKVVTAAEQLTIEECFDKYDRGIYPHPTDCTKFLSCATTDEMDCPAGLHFNAELLVCDWPANAGCMKTTTPSPTDPDLTTGIPERKTPQSDNPTSPKEPSDSTKNTPEEDASASPSPNSVQTTTDSKSDTAASENASPAETTSPKTTSQDAPSTTIAPETSSKAETTPSEKGTSSETTPAGEKSTPAESTPSETTSPEMSSTPAASESIPTTLPSESTPQDTKETTSAETSSTKPESTPSGTSDITDASTEPTKPSPESSTTAEQSTPPQQSTPASSSSPEASSTVEQSTIQATNYELTPSPSDSSTPESSSTPVSSQGSSESTPSTVEGSTISSDSSTSPQSTPSELSSTPSLASTQPSTSPESSVATTVPTTPKETASTDAALSQSTVAISTEPTAPKESASTEASSSQPPSSMEPTSTESLSSTDSLTSTSAAESTSPKESLSTEASSQSASPTSPAESTSPKELVSTETSQQSTALSSPKESATTEVTPQSSLPTSPAESASPKEVVSTEATSLRESSTDASVPASPSAPVEGTSLSSPVPSGQPSEPTSSKVGWRFLDTSPVCAEPVGPDCVTEPGMSEKTPHTLGPEDVIQPGTPGKSEQNQTLGPVDVTEPGMPVTQPPKEYPELSLRECLAKYKYGIFPHPTDNTKFYMCTKTKPRLMTCSLGLQFNPESRGCDRPAQPPPPPPPSLSLRECLTKFKKGIFPNPTDCTKFYGCTKRGPVELKCPAGLHFNPQLLSCDFPSRHCISPAAKTRDKILKTMKESKLVPDVMDQCPEKLAEVAFPSGAQMNLGNELTPTQTKDPPSIYWDADKRSYYTLCMVDPDAPRRKEASPNQWNHWMVGNIPGNNIRMGQTLSSYIGACPQKNSGFHRYTFLIFRQNKRINFKEPLIPNTTYQNRDNFSVRNFAQKYSLGQPVAGNFYKCRWDPYVPKLQKQIGFNPVTYSQSLIKSPNSYSRSYSYSYSFRM